MSLNQRDNLPFNHFGESLDTHPDFLLMKKMYEEECLELCGEDVTFETPLLENIPLIFAESKDDPMLKRDLTLITETKPTKIHEENVL